MIKWTRKSILDSRVQEMYSEYINKSISKMNSGKDKREDGSMNLDEGNM